MEQRESNCFFFRYTNHRLVSKCPIESYYARMIFFYFKYLRHVRLTSGIYGVDKKNNSYTALKSKSVHNLMSSNEEVEGLLSHPYS